MRKQLNTIVLDLGTTSIKAATCENIDQIVSIYSQPAPKISIDYGHCVSDALDYLNVVDQLLKKCLSQCPTAPYLGVCYQRSSFLIWNRHNGIPVTPLISWQDKRGQSTCDELVSQQTLIRQITGLPLTPYFFAPKLSLLLQQQPELLQDLLSNDLLTGTLDTFLIWHWSEGRHYLTDASMAARTLLMDIHTGQWSNKLSDIFKIPIQILPKISSSNNLNLKLKNGVFLKASVADQSAAMLASITNNDSEVLVNLGTGGFVVRYIPMSFSIDTTDYLRTLVFQDGQKNKVMALEGTLNSITAALLPYPFKTCEIGDLAEIEDIYCIAEPSGIGAPFFRSDIGLEFSKAIDDLSKRQIASLLLEGIIFRVALILEEFNQQAVISRVYLSGGLSTLPCLQQGIALCSPVPTYKIRQKHSGLQGVAFLTNNLAVSSNRLEEPILFIIKYHELTEKYQRWKIWFNQLINN